MKLITPCSSNLVASSTDRSSLSQMAPPPARKGGVFVESVDELVDKLKNEAGVL